MKQVYILIKTVSVLMHGKSLTLSQSTRKEISKLLTVTDQSHFFLFLAKFLRKSCLTPFLDTFKRTVFCMITNQVFNLLIHLSINYFLLFVIFMHLLILLPPPPNFKDVRRIFLDISRTFDRVRHEGLIYKMKCIGITGMPLKLMQDFLQNRHQQAEWSVFIMGTSFCWCTTWFCSGPFVLSNLHE